MGRRTLSCAAGFVLLAGPPLARIADNFYLRRERCICRIRWYRLLGAPCARPPGAPSHARHATRFQKTARVWREPVTCHVMRVPGKRRRAAAARILAGQAACFSSQEAGVAHCRENTGWNYIGKRMLRAMAELFARIDHRRSAHERCDGATHRWLALVSPSNVADFRMRISPRPFSACTA